jgi:hypothetical protein
MRARLVTLLCACAVLVVLGVPAQASAAFGFLAGSAGFEALVTRDGGAPVSQAGSHPAAFIAHLAFNQQGAFSDGDVRDLSLELPPGLIENPSAVAQCSQAAFHSPRKSPFETSRSGESCSDGAQIGVLSLTSSHGGGETRSFGIFNLQPPPGAPSQLGANPYGAPITFAPAVRQAGGEYGLTLQAKNISQLVSIKALELTIWGTPWSVSHDAQRGDCLKEAEPAFGWAKCSIGPPSSNPATPYLTMPTSCDGPLTFSATASSWQQPQTVSQSSQAPALEGCNSLAFVPNPRGLLSDPRASSPSGYDFEILQDTGGITEPNRFASSAVRKAVVTLPEGVTINPSVGAGLGVCTPAGYEAETPSSPPGAGCPNQSKIGDFTVKSPLFDETVDGSLFLAAPFQNPFGSLIAVYLVAKAPQRGILVKVAGNLQADPATGRLTATFDRLPQLPYSNLRVHFREGQRSPLASPPACGTFSTQIDLTAWRDPNLTRHTSSPATIAAGVGGGPCPSGLAPFTPTALAGSINSNAGSYTPFYLRLARSDSEQEITSYSAQLPRGLLGKIAGVPFCPEAAIAAAKQRTGVAERDNPSCPAASLIGHTYSGYGLGSVLSYAPGNLYLAGPYHGSPISVVAIDSALVGPFDLGVVIVRSAIKVDPQTTQVSIDSAGSDPIPHIIDGIPIHLRDVRVYIDRPSFAVNPTSCNRFSVASTLQGSGARFSDPADDTFADAIYNYQAFNCGSLGFKPAISLRMKGQTKRGDYPSLRVKVTPRPGDANIASAQVALPPSVFLAQNHIDTLCTKGQFARKACPPGSIYGQATAYTPLIEEPLSGPVYLRSSDNLLPDLVFALNGRGIEVDLAGKIDSLHGGLRGSFDLIPDAPVSKFILRMRGGKHGILQNAANVCTSTQLGSARFSGQSNQALRLRPRLQANCAHGHKGKAKQKGSRR